MPSSAPQVQGQRKIGRWKKHKDTQKMIVALLPERSIAHISVFPSSVFSISIENYPLLSTHSQALETHRNGLKFWINHFMNGVILDKSFSLVQLSFSHSEKSEPSQAPKIR